ncbi:MAG: 3-dehydroquinate synthase [Candidatus Omnitrophica bacterium]|nr:3-dehydroquinate synthase [Candidatus Omnitrophota bacterium]
MSLSLKVNLRDNSYKIVIGHNILQDLGGELKALNLNGDAIIITHPVLKKYYGKVLEKSLASVGFGVKFFAIAEGEESKSAKVFIKLLEEIAKYDENKSIFIVALGGGVIGDVSGFVAATYRRGIPYVQVPTTLLAQIDSAIGGKTAIDLSVGKNLAGAFYQPILVYSDVAVLATLDKRQIRNGLSEAVKYGVISDRRLFDFIARHVSKLINLDSKVLSEIVYQCSRIKAKVVEQDEKETKSIRTILNFGHTIGHAIEAAGKFRVYQHGEAVALGMRVASELSVRLKYLTAKEAATLGGVLSDIGLPEKISGVKLPEILKHMMHDKKFKAGKPRFVLATGLGTVKVVEGVSIVDIKAAIQSYL